MEKEKKELKILSILILALVAFTFITTVVDLCLHGLPKVTDIPADMTKEMAEISVIIAVVIGFLILVPQIYVGVKGLKVAAGEKAGKATFVCTIVLIILAITSTISAIIKLTKGFNFTAVLNVLDPALDVAVFVLFYIYARKILKAQ